MAKVPAAPMCLRCKTRMEIKGTDNKAVCPKCGWSK